VADLYDMIHPNANDTLTVRSVFIIGPDKKVKLTLTYPASTGATSTRSSGCSTPCS
jgi:alkyl hydroperoxide reductase subunit AhpC